MYKINADPMTLYQNSIDVCRNRKKILKFTQKHKRPSNSPNRDQAEREQGWCSTVLSSLCHLHSGQGQGCHNDLHSCGHLIFNKGVLKWREKTHTFQQVNGTRKTGATYRTAKWDLFTLGKNHLEMCQRSQCKTLKLLEETQKISRYNHGEWLSK